MRFNIKHDWVHKKAEQLLCKEKKRWFWLHKERASEEETVKLLLTVFTVKQTCSYVA